MSEFRVEKKLLILLLMILLNSIPIYGQNWQLIWSDEFDSSDVSLSKWEIQIGDGTLYGLPPGWGNNELQYYTNRPENINVNNGILIITADQESYMGYNYTSARMRTMNQGDWTYGRFEMRAKLPFGQGLWPAFWMMPTDAVYGGWAASGEIDIMELLGQEPSKVYGTLHHGGSWPNNIQTRGEYLLTVGTFADTFHVFSLEWEPGEIRWYVDGIHYLTQTSWWTTGGPFPAPFDERFHIILNLAVGGNWPGPPGPGTTFPQRMEVDYIRVFQDTNQRPMVAIISPSNGANFQPGSSIPIVVSAIDTNGSISEVRFYQGDAVIVEDLSLPFEIAVQNAFEGAYSLRATAKDDSGITSYSEFVDISVGGAATHSPYLITPVHIPGTIEAENYDLGGQGVAYDDADPGINNGSSTGAYFRRQEGVDIEQTLDTGGGFNVGWIEDGEWMEYFINVNATGTYSISARVASQNGGGAFYIQVDGQNVTPILNVPPTGGWQSWSTVTRENVNLTYGIHHLRLIIINGDFNLNKLIISRVTDIRDDFWGSLPEEFSLSQNYPNPFNPGTSIEFSLPMSDRVTLEVFSINGEKVETLIDEVRPAGIHRTEFDRNNMASGVYLYRIQAGDFTQTHKMILLR